MTEFFVGDKIGQGEIIKKEQSSHRKTPTYLYSIKCTCCNQTIRENIYLSELKVLKKRVNPMCNSCRVRQRNISNRQVKIGKKFGKLTVIGDAGYKKQPDGKQRHYSIVQCDCGSAPFEIMDNKIQNGNTQSCGCLHSRGEGQIQKGLDKKQIFYIKEYSFSDLSNKDNHKLRFDFAIFGNEKLYALIEFDGRHHFEGYDAGSGKEYSLEEIQERDSLKTKYCQNNNIKLIRIPYGEKENLDSILEQELKEVVPCDNLCHGLATSTQIQ